MTEVNGWHLPPDDGYFYKFVEGNAYKKNGFQREHLLAAFKHVRRWRLAIDVGAHVGFWTRDMAERFASVYAFEPATNTFDCLSKNMAEHPNVTITQAAVGDKSGTCEMRDDPSRPGNTGSRHVHPDKEAGTTRMLTLDGQRFPQCDLLKVDVEGFELQVLKGGIELICKHKPVIIMEVDKKRLTSRYGKGVFAAQVLLKECGYIEAAHMRPDKVFIPV